MIFSIQNSLVRSPIFWSSFIFFYANKSCLADTLSDIRSETKALLSNTSRPRIFQILWILRVFTFDKHLFCWDNGAYWCFYLKSSISDLWCYDTPSICDKICVWKFNLFFCQFTSSLFKLLCLQFCLLMRMYTHKQEETSFLLVFALGLVDSGWKFFINQMAILKALPVRSYIKGYHDNHLSILVLIIFQ